MSRRQPMSNRYYLFWMTYAVILFAYSVPPASHGRVFNVFGMLVSVALFTLNGHYRKLLK